MRAWRWLLGLGAALVVALPLAAWLVPPALDWDRYRVAVAVLASDALGQVVRIDGPITLRLLPEPVLTARTVALAQNEGGIAVTAKALRLRVALAPLLAGRVDARELVVQGVDARFPWPLGRAALALRAPGWLSALSARIEDGRIAIGATVFSDVQATLSTAQETGTWAASGTAKLGARGWHFTSRVSRPGADGSATVDLTLDAQGPGAGTGAALSGQVAADGTVTGRASGRGTDLSAFLPAPAVPFRAEGRFVMAGGLAFADELVGEIGGSPVSGAVSLRLEPSPRLDVALAASRLDLDAWLPPLLRGGGLVGTLPIGVDLSAEAAQLAGGTLRRLRGGLSFAGGNVTVRDVRAVLPGDAALRVDGQVLPANGSGRSAVFDGSVALEAPALRTTLAWLATGRLGRVAALPPLVLTRASLRAHAVGGAEQVTFDGIAGQVDGADVSGTLTLRPGVVPGVRGALRVDRLDLGAWFGGLPGRDPAAWAARLGGMEGALQIDAGQAVLPGLVLAPFALDVGVEPARVTLRRVAFEADGIEVSAAGTLAAGGRIGDGKLDVRAADGRKLAAWLPEEAGYVALRASPVWHAAASATLSAAGPPEALAVRATADLGDLHVETQPVLDLPAGKLAGPVLLRHPGLPRLAQQLGVPGLAAWLGEGSLGLVAKIAVTPQTIALDNFDLSAGALHATGALEQARGGERMLTGRIAADTLPLLLPDAGSREPLTLGWLSAGRAQLRLEAGRVLGASGAVLEKARATATLALGVLRLDDIAGSVGGGQVTGQARLDVSGAVPQMAATLALRDVMAGAGLFGTPVDISGAPVTAEATLSAQGFAPAAVVGTLVGMVSVRLGAGVLEGIDLGPALPELHEGDLRAGLAGGRMAFDGLEASLRLSGGVVQVERARMTAPGGTITATGDVDLPGRTMALRLAIVPAVPDPPELGLRLSGNWAAPQRMPELSGLVPWRAARGL